MKLGEIMSQDPHFQPDDELRRFLEEYAATDGRMYKDSKPGLKTPRPRYYGREPSQTLAFARADRGMTQLELASWTGTTRRTIIGIESGNREPSVYLALAIAQALEMQVEDIFHLPPLTPVPPSKY